jgi:glutamine synthetase
MRYFDDRCGAANAQRTELCEQLARRIEVNNIERISFTYADLHGAFRSKTLLQSAAVKALRNGIGMVGTICLKDAGDKTAFPVFDAQAMQAFVGLEKFAMGGNLQLLPDPSSFHVLPWDSSTGWLRCTPYFQDGSAIPIDARGALTSAIEKLSAQGLEMVCGLELEFHIYRIQDIQPRLNPELAAWPGLPPKLEMLHPGYRLLSQEYEVASSKAMRIVEQTALALDMPLQSVEVEFGPSQFEAVFDATPAMQAADNTLLFRNLVRQALLREGYYASFVCRPPFPNIMSSGWHLHQSLAQVTTGDNVFMRSEPGADDAAQASHYLSALGSHYLAGLLEHASALAAICVPTSNGYERFRPNALAPVSINWGADSRAAMLRVIGSANDPATRIENRLGEPLANPYLVMASHIFAGLDGIAAARKPPANTAETAMLPSNLGHAIQALESNQVLRDGLGETLVNWYCQIKRTEAERFARAGDKNEIFAREYFSRF